MTIDEGGSGMLYFFLAMLETQEERDKFTLIYERYYKLLIDIAYSILHNGQDAEDAVQQAFLKLLPNLGKIEDVSSHQTVKYLVIMVRRVCFYMYNNKIIHIPFEDLTEGDLGILEDDLIERMEYAELLERVKSLPDIYGDVLYLMYCEDFSVKEIASSLDITVNAAKKRLERARQQLKGLLLTDEEAINT
jgi:RNA polymerase sigma-70 factor (ECF subfamily)